MEPWLCVAPTMVGGLLSPLARAPAQLEGLPLGQREPYSRKMLVSLGPQLQASPLHTGSRVRYCLGWQKAQETMRGWRTFVPVLRVGMFVHMHDRGWQMEQESRVCGQGGRCQGTFSSMTQTIGFHFPSTSRTHTALTRGGKWLCPLFSGGHIYFMSSSPL